MIEKTKIYTNKNQRSEILWNRSNNNIVYQVLFCKINANNSNNKTYKKDWTYFINILNDVHDKKKQIINKENHGENIRDGMAQLSKLMEAATDGSNQVVFHWQAKVLP